MKKHEIYLLCFFTIHFLLLLIHCESKNETENTNNNPSLENTTNTNDTDSDDSDIINEDEGFFISDEIFDEKLQKILEERNLKPKKKITKQQLRIIFELIYKTEKKQSDPENIDGISQEAHSKEFMDSIFSESTKSLDYDDKISVKKIKEWINPLRVQKAYAELLQGLAENIDYL